jgi:hypothetical protein
MTDVLAYFRHNGSDEVNRFYRIDIWGQCYKTFYHGDTVSDIKPYFLDQYHITMVNSFITLPHSKLKYCCNLLWNLSLIKCKITKVFLSNLPLAKPMFSSPAFRTLGCSKATSTET